MKKIAIVVMLFALTLTLLGGCFKLPKNIIPKPSDSQSDTNNETTADKEDTQDAEDNGQEDDSNSGAVEELTPATNPSEGFSNYSTYKSAAYDRITTASEGSDSLSMAVGFGYLGVTMIDLSLLPLTSLVGDPETSQAAMAFLFTDAKVSGTGNDFTITYKDSDGAEIKQTCTYDPGKDQMTSTMYSADGSIGIFFEYVNLGGAYAAQYYYPSDDGYEVIRAYFDKDNVAAFGILSADKEPASIIGQSSFDQKFVENEQSYIVLVDGKLSVFDNGETTTN